MCVGYKSRIENAATARGAHHRLWHSLVPMPGKKRENAAHLLDRAKLLDKETYQTFIGNCFKNPMAAELQQLLDFVADEFSSSKTPLIER